jgi:lysophospholipase L1-like esterase
MHQKPFLIALGCFLLSLCLGAAPTPAPATTGEPPASNPATIPTLFIAGDSTATTGAGWGAHFQDYFDPAKLKIVNGARGGLSSRTFITNRAWDAVISKVQTNDYVIIQFGHNDNGPVDTGPMRGTMPSIGEETKEIPATAQRPAETVHTFGWYMRQMINDVKAKNANPIVVSMTVRGEWTDGKVERGFGDCARLSGELAKGEGVRYIDLTNMVADRYEELGQAAVKPFFPRDTTHTNADGSKLNADSIISGFKALHEYALINALSAQGRAIAVSPAKYALAPKLAVPRGLREVFERWLNLPEVSDPKLPTIFLIGDSTVRNGRGDGVDGQWGWGDPLALYFDPAKVNLVNRAVGGMTAASFMSGRWLAVKEMLKAGDFVFMQFGTNSEGLQSFTDNLHKYVADIKAKGATPVVCTLVPRNSWANGKLMRTDPHAAWARDAAQADKTQLLDLNNLIADQYDVIGREATTALFESGPHTNRKGAEFAAKIIADTVKTMPNGTIAKYLREKPAANW